MYSATLRKKSNFRSLFRGGKTENKNSMSSGRHCWIQGLIWGAKWPVVFSESRHRLQKCWLIKRGNHISRLSSQPPDRTDVTAMTSPRYVDNILTLSTEEDEMLLHAINNNTLLTVSVVRSYVQVSTCDRNPRPRTPEERPLLSSWILE